MIKIREIKSYALRTSRMTEGQRKAYNEFYDKYTVKFSEDFIDLKNIFSYENAVVEIGFGMGDATIKLAEKNKDIGYIAIDVHKPGIGKVLAEVEKKKISNLKVIEYDAVPVFQKMIPDGSLYGVHIFFPDPWPKKKHHKRRLIKEEFINILSSKLKQGGYIFIATDWEEYAHFILREMNKVKTLKNQYDGFTDKIEWRPQTKFERKGLKKDHKVWELFFEKI